MSRPKSPKRNKAFKIWNDSGRTLTSPQLAERMGVSSGQIRKWRHEENWDEKPEKRPRGAPKGNSNAIGNSGGSGGPEGNDKALKHGAYSQFLPKNEKFQELLREVQQMEPLDMLWNSIEIAYAKLLWSQEILFVADTADETKVLTKHAEGKFGDSLEWEYQHAGDKQARDITAYAAISRELRASIKQFLNAAPEDDLRRAKINLMQTQVEKIRADVKSLGDPDGKSGVTIVDDIPKGEQP